MQMQASRQLQQQNLEGQPRGPPCAQLGQALEANELSRSLF